MSALGRLDEILLAAAHPVTSPPRAERLARLLTPEVDWPTLIEHLDRHGVAPVAYGHFGALPPAAIPPDARRLLAARARAVVANDLCLRHELGRLLAAFSRARVDVMPLKGPVLADQLYPAPWLRPSGDLDLLVRMHEAAAAERVLEALGYARRPDAEQGADYHTIFTADGVEVELHRDLGEAHVSRPDVDAVWAAAAPGEWDGHPIWRMAVPDQLVYLAFHAVKDGLASVRSLVDITLLVEQHREALPWPTLVARVRAARLAPVIYLALGESRALLGAPVPDHVVAALRPRHAGWALAQRLFRWRGGVLHVADDLLVGPFMAVLMLLWEDTPRARLRHLRRNLLPAARLRRRWTSDATPWVLAYPVWAARAVSDLVRQASGIVGELRRREQPRPVLGAQPPARHRPG
jgi:putative nucleotidyltransferase-like protein